MALRGDISGTQPVNQIRTVQQIAPVGSLQQAITTRLNRLDIGQQFRAEVMTRSESGSAFVRLDADTVVEMNLPRDAQVGDKVSLTFIAKEPRPTFLYQQQSGSVQSSLSTAGRTITNILQSAAQAEGEAAPTLVGKTPLLPSGAAMLPAQLAASLQHAIVQSGLFYEAHLAQWMVGNRSISDLKQEPQAQMKPDGTSAQAAPKDGNIPVQTQLQQSPSSQTAALTQGLVHKQGEAVSDSDAIKESLVKVVLSDDQAKQPIVDKEAAQMIRMQLDAMEQRRIIWQGQLLPGQDLEWEISEDTPKQKKETEGTVVESSWQSILRMELPRLGSLSVTMRLTGDQVQVYMQAKSVDAVTALRAHGQELAQALSDIGTRLDYLTVKDGSA